MILSDPAIHVLSEYFNMLGFELRTTAEIKGTFDGDDSIDNIDEKKIEMKQNDEVTTSTGITSEVDDLVKLTINGKLNQETLVIVNKHFNLMEQGYNAFVSNDLCYLLSQGVDIFCQILESLGIDLSVINETNKVNTHYSCIFTSKFITFTLHQLNLENRDARLS